MLINTILLTEPKRVDHFYPFSIMHPVWELRCGAFKLYEKYEKHFPGTMICYSARQDHLDSFLARTGKKNEMPGSPGNTLVVDACMLINTGLKKHIEDMLINRSDEKFVFTSGDNLVAVYIPGRYAADYPGLTETAHPSDIDTDGFEEIKLNDVFVLSYLWDAIFRNGGAIRDDELLLSASLNKIKPDDYPGASFINQGGVSAGDAAEIMPGAVIDASDGPVIIGSNVRIMPQATIIGPCYIGDNSIVKIGAKIYEDCSFGEWCKVGGEIENTIIQAYSNKQHEGFLGHSFISEWVNLGADTNNSDLKNTYSDIKIMLEDEEIDTGMMFLGLLCGDHTKSAINTSFTTGTVAGICGILVHEGFHPRFIPSFSWGGRKDSPIYKASKAIEIAKIVLGRRGKELLPEEEKLIQLEYQKSKS